MTPSSAYLIGIISLGCAKNLVDAEHMGARLRNAGYSFTTDISKAEILLVNTCGFIRDASQESIDAILEAAAMKTEGACRLLVVTGCLTQRYTRDLAGELPEVDLFLGVDQLDEIVGRLDAWRHGIAFGSPMPEMTGLPHRLFEPPESRQPLTGGPFAYVKIAEGCNHRCAFCAIPAIRGRLRSRSIGSIRTEIERLLSNGIREINLVAQDTTAYGRDRDDRATLTQLIRELGRIGGDFWIRMLYGFPSLVRDDLLQAMAETPRICRYLDVPIQHSDPEVLRRMGRAGTRQAVQRLAARARRSMPDITLRTTCLVGHPGETDAAFDDLRRFLAETEFDHLGVFVFSPEEGTRSATADTQVPTNIARQRRNLLMRDQQRRVLARQKKRIGQIERILVETMQPGKRVHHGVGRAMRQAPEVDGVIQLKGRQTPPRPGDFVNARYTEVKDYDLMADIL